MKAIAGWSACLLVLAGCQSGKTKLPAPAASASTRPQRAAGASGPAAAGKAEGDLPASHPLAPAVLETQTRLGLRVLRARLLEENLGRSSRLAVPAGPRTFGDTVPVTIRIANPLAFELELEGPEDGLRIELESRRERWFPLGQKEVFSRNFLARVPSGAVLAPGGILEQSFSLALEPPPGDPSSLWVVYLQARLHLDGVRSGGDPLPAHEIRLTPIRMLVFPKGWESLAAEPLASLHRVLATPSPQVERHLLVCAALLPPEKRREGLALLMDALVDNPAPRRSRSITTALAWLTGREPSQSPAAWYAWWEKQPRSNP